MAGVALAAGVALVMRWSALVAVLRGRRGTWRHPEAFGVAGMALGEKQSSASTKTVRPLS